MPSKSSIVSAALSTWELSKSKINCTVCLSGPEIEEAIWELNNTHGVPLTTISKVLATQFKIELSEYSIRRHLKNRELHVRKLKKVAELDKGGQGSRNNRKPTAN